MTRSTRLGLHSCRVHTSRSLLSLQSPSSRGLVRELVVEGAVSVESGAQRGGLQDPCEGPASVQEAGGWSSHMLEVIHHHPVLFPRSASQISMQEKEKTRKQHVSHTKRKTVVRKEEF